MYHIYIYIKFQHPGLNVPLIQNALITLHVLEKNAKILASPARVESMLNVRLKGIGLYVFVVQDTKEILTEFVKSVR